MASGRSGLLVLILLTALLSCNDSTENEDQLTQKIDSLSGQIIQLQKQVTDSKNKQNSDSSSPFSIATQDKKNIPFQNLPTTLKSTPAPQQKPVKGPILNPLRTMVPSESEFYYYKSLPKRVSVEITSWINGKRKVIFYDPFGHVNYTCEDVHLSYSITTQLKKFHDNGAVALIEIHDNPGASIYWYETQITFGINNEPQWKTSIQKPEMSLEQSMNNKFWWNKKTKQWVKQEVIKEQPYPHH